MGTPVIRDLLEDATVTNGKSSFYRCKVARCFAG
jgi:hypothetical protein